MKHSNAPNATLRGCWLRGDYYGIGLVREESDIKTDVV